MHKAHTLTTANPEGDLGVPCEAIHIKEDATSTDGEAFKVTVHEGRPHRLIISIWSTAPSDLVARLELDKPTGRYRVHRHEIRPDEVISVTALICCTCPNKEIP